MDNKIANVFMENFLYQCGLNEIINQTEANHWKQQLEYMLKAIFESGKKVGREEILNEKK